MLLNDMRKEIDFIDEKLLDLLLERLEVVKNIKKYKNQHNILIYDEKRENEIIAKAFEKYKESENWPYIEKFLINLMAISKSYQNEV